MMLDLIAAFALVVMQQSAAPTPSDCRVNITQNTKTSEIAAILKCLEARIRVLEGGGVAVSASKSVGASPKATVAAAVESGGFRFEVEACRKSGPGIQCKIFITSVGADQRLAIYGSGSPGTFVVDSLGAQYAFSGYQGIGERGFESPSITRSFIADVRTAANFQFSGQVDVAAPTIAALQIGIQPGNQQTRAVTIRNIALQK